MIFIGILDFLGVRGCLLRNSRIPSPTASAVFYRWLSPAGLSAGSAFKRFLALKPCAAQPLCKNFCTLFLWLAP